MEESKEKKYVGKGKTERGEEAREGFSEKEHLG